MRPASKTTTPLPCPQYGHGATPLVPGANMVLIGDAPATRLTDMTGCGAAVISGDPKVLINGLPAARVGDLTNHGGAVVSGQPDVLIGPDSIVFRDDRLGELMNLLDELKADVSRLTTDVARQREVMEHFAKQSLKWGREAGLGGWKEGKAGAALGAGVQAGFEYKKLDEMEQQLGRAKEQLSETEQSLDQHMQRYKDGDFEQQ